MQGLASCSLVRKEIILHGWSLNKKALLCYNLCWSLLASRFLSDCVWSLLYMSNSLLFTPNFPSVVHFSGNVQYTTCLVPVGCLWPVAKDSARAMRKWGGCENKCAGKIIFALFLFLLSFFFPLFFSFFILVRFLFLAFLWSSYFRSWLSVWFVNNCTFILSLTSNVGGWYLSFLKTIPDVLLFKVHFSSKQRRSHGE